MLISDVLLVLYCIFISIVAILLFRWQYKEYRNFIKQSKELDEKYDNK